MADPASSHAPQPKGATGVLVLADGTLIWGRGFGAEGSAVGEVCFNTAMTGYQEVMTDPSYAAQIVTFTFPHIGNVGVNGEDVESAVEGAVGCVVREDVTAPSNFRSQGTFGDWLTGKGKIGLAGVDTRALTRRTGRAPPSPDRLRRLRRGHGGGADGPWGAAPGSNLGHPSHGADLDRRPGTGLGAARRTEASRSSARPRPPARGKGPG